MVYQALVSEDARRYRKNMTEKTNEKQQTDKKPVPQKSRKASTGAWWKSVTNLLAKKEEEVQPSIQDSAAALSLHAPKTSSPVEEDDKTEKKSIVTAVIEEQGEDTAGGKEKSSKPRPRNRQGRKGGREKGQQREQAVADSNGNEQKPGRGGEKKKGAAPARPSEGNVVTKLLINAEEPEECRIALIENGRLESFHLSTSGGSRTKNNIYKGRIVAVEANLQAAFVDIGTERNGFLPFAEIHPEYYREDVSERCREFIIQHQWKKLKIEDVVKKGQEVLVQVVKEPVGNKGANMTTYLSLPGRFLVLMPGSDSSGISRKIVGESQRTKLREMMDSFSLPEGVGYIIRTASAEITKTALQNDLRFLVKLWREIKKNGQQRNAPTLLYQEQDTVVRFLRDHFVPQIHEILVDTEESLEKVRQFIALLPAKQQSVKIRLHKGARPIFNQHNIEEQIESIYRPQVQLPSGGSIVIDPTEALVAIDVNSGRTSKNDDFEETIFLANMEAAEELTRQLRLRDLGGLIVVDFIDMRSNKNIREVERHVKASLKRDKAKSDVSRISRFGLMQISRQKMGAPIEKGSYETCTHCQGRGVVRSVETQALYYLRRIHTGISRKKVERVECRLPLDVATYLLNRKRSELLELEEKNNAIIAIEGDTGMLPAESRIDFLQGEREQK
ncbi:MAG: ribonuclease E [Desulfobulbus propionicus]|nr:MAG: ribonuclease E [Desulfobulbus propionicus]